MHEDEAITGAGETSKRGADGADPTVEAKGLEALSTKTGGPETTPWTVTEELQRDVSSH